MAMDLFYGKVRTDLERIEEMLDGVNEMAKEFGITSKIYQTICTPSTQERETHLSSVATLRSRTDLD